MLGSHAFRANLQDPGCTSILYGGGEYLWGLRLSRVRCFFWGWGSSRFRFDGKGEQRTAMLISESAFGFGDAERKCEGAERLLCAFVDADPRG
jgi:hypothetical protein